MYRRVQYCNDVAAIAHERLVTKLQHQNVFAQTAYLGGVNAGGSERVEDANGDDALPLA